MRGFRSPTASDRQRAFCRSVALGMELGMRGMSGHEHVAGPTIYGGAQGLWHAAALLLHVLLGVLFMAAALEPIVSPGH